MGIYRIRIIDRATGHPWGSHRYTDLRKAQEAYERAKNRGGQVVEYLFEECIFFSKRMRWFWRKYSTRNKKKP